MMLRKLLAGAAAALIAPSVALAAPPSILVDTNGVPFSSTNPFPTTPSPSPAAGAGIAPVVSSALESCHVLKASAGNLYSLGVTIQATTGIVQLFDATSAPTDGAVTPKWSQPVLSNGTLGGASWQWSVPMAFATGVTVCFSSATTPYTKTASATASFSGDVQ